jgi:subtilisin family serine protease
MIKLTSSILSLFLLQQAYAADIIVRLNKPADLKNLPEGYTLVEPLIPALNVYLLRDNTKSALSIDAFNRVRSHSTVKSAMMNEPMTLRTIEPNDPKFAEEWGMQKIEAPGAWTMGVGGKNSQLDEVVVAVVDGGSDLSHDDLVNNAWINKKEIPGNKIDDDNNGYIDDVNGWNAFKSTGEIPKAEHGTHVSGIIGAQGNNGKFTTGVNWNVKIMAVAASSNDTAIVLKGYGYVLAAKKLWIETKGRSGANVVATNSSFGIDRAVCMTDRYKMWNDIYEEMGKVGILSAVATANSAWDIDATGDVPSSCASDYVVSVTNSTKDDTLYNSAGWGATQIDIAAPGTNVMSTVPGNSAKNMTGTSMATPHVAGSIGFLMSVASNTFTVMSKENPAKAALELKAILLNNVDQLDAFKGKTVSGGRLNLKKSAEVISRY